MLAKEASDSDLKRTNRIAYDAARFEEWKKMRDGTLYYDTGACINGPHIGDINKMSFTMTNDFYKDDTRTLLDGTTETVKEYLSDNWLTEMGTTYRES